MACSFVLDCSRPQHPADPAAAARCKAGPIAAVTARPRAPAAAAPLTRELVGPSSGWQPDGNLVGFCHILDRRTAEQYLQQLHGWQLVENRWGRLTLQRTYTTAGFGAALALSERIAVVAEEEGRHPDLHLTGWNRLTVSIWSQACRGLTELDAILASRIDRMNKEGLLAQAAEPVSLHHWQAHRPLPGM